MSKSTFRILFYIRKNQVNKEGKAGIMIRLTVNGEIAQFSSKLDVEPDLWDVNSQKMQFLESTSAQFPAGRCADDIEKPLSRHRGS